MHPGIAAVASFTASVSSPSRSVRTTAAPSLARQPAIARPIPLSEPETSATRPFSLLTPNLLSHSSAANADFQPHRCHRIVRPWRDSYHLRLFTGDEQKRK